jgi:8-oxo-dGTP pyrophosphatase MutT (NUDIX family)
VGVIVGIRDRLTYLRKAFGSGAPAQMQAGESAAGMDHSTPFSPGTPIGPYDGFSRVPRSRDFVTGYNIAARPRSRERVSFETLRGLVDSYDVSQIAIWHRIDAIRALGWSVVAAPGFHGDASAAIERATDIVKRPDPGNQTPGRPFRRNGPTFNTWLAKWLWDVLAYDAGALYRVRNRRGDAIGLRPVDGTLVAPLLDYWGNTPAAPAEAYVQYANGLPWNWLTADDMVYQPFRPRTSSPYGVAPLESILLNANTDLRFQAFFLQRFTDGNIPEAFAAAPEGWTPQQIEQFQALWDAMLQGDIAVKHQIKWMPGGSSITWSNEKEFDDKFSLFMMRKTCAAYHVTPASLGFTENVNKSSGDSQADVQENTGDSPLASYAEDILTEFLQEDCHLPVAFKFDSETKAEDRLKNAQVWQIGINTGMASADEGREEVFGLPADAKRPTPRFFVTGQGPLPLSSIPAGAARVDPETFTGNQPAEPEPTGTADPEIVQVGPATQPETVAKDDAPGGGPTVGVTSATGICGYDLAGRHDDEDDEDREQLVKSELASFKAFRAKRRRAKSWRDFEFRAVDGVRGHRLNDAGRLAVRKAAGEIAVAGLAVRAADTGRVLMLQRALCDDDPAAGTLEFPGGHIEGDEVPMQGAWREWAEECGQLPPPGELTGQWESGIYRGHVWTVPDESHVQVGNGRDAVTNPDDPDGDQIEALLWMHPDHLPGNPALRPELADDLHIVLPQLRRAVMAKADDGPNGWAAWRDNDRTADHWAPLVAAALAAVFTHGRGEQLAQDFAATAWTGSRTAVVDAVGVWLITHGLNPGQRLGTILERARTDGAWLGYTSATAQLGRSTPTGWQPGATHTATASLAVAGIPVPAGQPIGSGIVAAVARAMIDTTAAGATADIVAAAMVTALDAPARALAMGEILAAQAAAAMTVYRRAGIRNGRWLAHPGSCDVCLANEAAGVVPLGTPYPSGHTDVPAHPSCGCAIINGDE